MTGVQTCALPISDIILADEPTGNLDADTAQGIVEIFQELAHKDGKCVIAVTHSQDFAAQADVVVELKGNKLRQREACGA